jgi:Zn-dependent M28 family amino/carboxypeptidase
VNIKTFLKNSSALLSESYKTASELKRVSSTITEYIQKETIKKHILLNKINACNSIFETLEITASAMLESARILKNKIILSCAAFEVTENAEAMLKDMREGFPVIIHNDSAEKEKQIQLILDKLNNISYQCAHFQTFPKPYKEVIDLYNVKIESVFDAVVQKKAADSAATIAKQNDTINDLKKILDDKTKAADTAATVAAATIAKQNDTIHNLKKILDDKTKAADTAATVAAATIAKQTETIHNLKKIIDDKTKAANVAATVAAATIANQAVTIRNLQKIVDEKIRAANTAAATIAK